METFDLVKFQRNEKSENYSFKQPNGDDVQQFGNINDIFVERIEEKSSPYGTYSEFYGDGKLKRRGKTFYGFMIGIQYVYDKKGKQIDSVDFDAPFKFSINDLIVKMKASYHVNILDRESKLMVFRQALPKPSYAVTIPLILGVSEVDRKVVIIDGISGEILSETIRYYTK